MASSFTDHSHNTSTEKLCSSIMVLLYDIRTEVAIECTCCIEEIDIELYTLCSYRETSKIIIELAFIVSFTPQHLLLLPVASTHAQGDRE